MYRALSSMGCLLGWLAWRWLDGGGAWRNCGPSAAVGLRPTGQPGAAVPTLDVRLMQLSLAALLEVVLLHRSCCSARGLCVESLPGALRLIARSGSGRSSFHPRRRSRGRLAWLRVRGECGLRCGLRTLRSDDRN